MKTRAMILALLMALPVSALGCTGTAEAPAAMPVLSELYSPPPAATPTPAPTARPMPTPAPTPEPNDQYDRRTIWMQGVTADPAWSEYGGDNFSEILLWLLYQYKLAPEAACGIAANMWYESSFQPTVEADTGSYGLCQWVGVRKTRLREWCCANGYDGDTVEGQLAYMMHELESYSVELTGSARACAESFCRVFEVPPDTEMQAGLRGDYAEALYARFFGR